MTDDSSPIMNITPKNKPKSPPKLHKKLEAKRIAQNNQVVAAKTKTHYIVLNSHQDLLDTILESPVKNYYEYIPPKTPVNLYFDIEIYPQDSGGYFENPAQFIQLLKKTINGLSLVQVYQKKWIVLESHNASKKSFHVLVRLIDKEGNEWYFKSYEDLKSLYKSLGFGKYTSGDKQAKMIDPAVYRDGLFRTIYSSKEGEERPLVRSELSDEFLDIDTFVTFIRNTQNLIIFDAKIKKTIEHDINILETELDKKSSLLIQKEINKLFGVSTNLLLDPFIDPAKNCIVVPSEEKYCHFVKREHKSNHQYFVIDCFSIKQKCHDSDCAHLKHLETRIAMLPKTFTELLKRFLKLNDEDLSRIDTALEDSQKLIQLYDNDADKVTYNQIENTFVSEMSNSSIMKMIGRCQQCKAFHIISSQGYFIECDVCKSRQPLTGYLPIQPSIYNFFTQINIQNNTTIIMQNDDDYLYTDIILDDRIYNDTDLTMIMCNALHGHKTAQMAEFFSKINDNIVYSDKIWYYFEIDIWKEDKEGFMINYIIMIKLTEELKKITNFYKNETGMESLLENIDKLIIKLNKPSFQTDILTGCKKHLVKDGFKSELNSKLYLLPFLNGVYDLSANKFRAYLKEDLISKRLDYDYNPQVENDSVYNFFSQIITDESTRHYLLQKISHCLNGEMSNEHFHIFNGRGSNGKSQLINLIVETLGCFTSKVDISFVTQKRQDSSSASPQKVGLYNKRFAYFAEPSANDTFNDGLLKEITGNEDITARNLYESEITFRLHAKFFLACNTIPSIQADEGTQRRIFVIDFNSKFVDDPQYPHEFKKDPSIPTRIKNDITFRQGFMNILLDYYYKPRIDVPDYIKLTTSAYQEDNQPSFDLFDKDIVYKKEHFLLLTDFYEHFNAKSNKEKKQMSHDFIMYISNKYPNDNPKISKPRMEDGKRYRGWYNFDITSDDIPLLD